ncbi:nucleotidyltransferase domain-containing protein [bacterium]|nr:nucleotidyltransferase domain-containing protein [bacterium]
MKSEIDFLIEEAKAEEKYLKNYKFWVKRIKKEAEKYLGEVRVFVFGSILKKSEVPRDIDVLIISPKLKSTEQKSQARVKIQQKIGFGKPFEIHLITPEEYKNWYRFFIKKKIEIK